MDPYNNLYKGIPSACGLSFVTENGYVNPSLNVLSKSLDIKPFEFKDFAIKNENSIVYALIEREQVMCSESEEHIDKFYDGSLKLFFSTFLRKEKLTIDEINELKKIIKKHGGEI